MAEHASKPLDPNQLFGHVKDATSVHVPRFLAPGTHGHIEIPQPFELSNPLVTHTNSALINRTIEPLDFKITKFMLIELAAALILCAFFIGLARALKGGAIARGRLRNALEAMLLYFRDNVARPCIGGHDADKFVPFLWTIFFFILTCNLFGLVPWLGSPTASLATTGALAFVTFIIVVGSGMKK